MWLRSIIISMGPSEIQTVTTHFRLTGAKNLRVRASAAFLFNASSQASLSSKTLLQCILSLLINWRHMFYVLLFFPIMHIQSYEKRMILNLYQAPTGYWSGITLPELLMWGLTTFPHTADMVMCSEMHVTDLQQCPIMVLRLAG